MKLNMQNGIAAEGVKEPFLKGIMEGLKVFLAEHYYFRYNTVAICSPVIWQLSA